MIKNTLYYNSTGGATTIATLKAAEINVLDTSSRSRTFSSQISLLKQSSKADPDLFLFHIEDEIDQHIIIGASEACKNSNVPLVLCSNSRLQENVADIAKEMNLGYVRSHVLMLEAGNLRNKLDDAARMARYAKEHASADKALEAA